MMAMAHDVVDWANKCIVNIFIKYFMVFITHRQSFHTAFIKVTFGGRQPKFLPDRCKIQDETTKFL